jgi:hypothetical protein
MYQAHAVNAYPMVLTWRLPALLYDLPSTQTLLAVMPVGVSIIAQNLPKQ